jgi:hypothetical protein
MNERIREIAKEAGLEFDDDEALEFGKEIYYVTKEDIEKFAELIILESKCWIHKRIGPKTALDFLEHFGVGE